ncbi:hypothetical protein T439DRAFT_109761 [Meredithblackwellia eburnea MCA 4105]
MRGIVASLLSSGSVVFKLSYSKRITALELDRLAIPQWFKYLLVVITGFADGSDFRWPKRSSDKFAAGVRLSFNEVSPWSHILASLCYNRNSPFSGSNTDRSKLSHSSRNLVDHTAFFTTGCIFYQKGYCGGSVSCCCRVWHWAVAPRREVQSCSSRIRNNVHYGPKSRSKILSKIV